jgi:hypothetical protein
MAWTGVIVVIAAAAGATGHEAYPDAAYSSPPVDRLRQFEHLCNLGIGGGDSVARAAAFVYNTIAPETDGGVRATRWRFLRRPEPLMGAALNVSERLRRPAEAISFRVRNDSPERVRFDVIVDKMPWEPGPEFQGGTWIAAAPGAVAPGAEATVRVRLADAVPAEGTDLPRIVYPAGFYIRVANPEAGVPFDLLLSDLAIHYPEARGVTGAALVAPERVDAGEPAAFEVSADEVAPARRLDIELLDGDRVLWRIRLSPEETARLRDAGRARVERPVPFYLPQRSMKAALVADGYRVPGGEATLAVGNARRPGFPTAELRSHRGLPAVFLDGEPFAWSGYASYEFQPGNVADFGASGAKVFVVPVAAGQHVHQIVDPTWTGPEEWDFGDLDERVGMALQANPDGFLEFRMNLALPPFWIADHPDAKALVRSEAGDVPWQETGTQAISIASRAWREDQAAAVRRLIAYCEEQPWADRVIAFVISGEVTEEWFAWACNDGHHSDYSPPMQAAFAAWCAERGLSFERVPAPDARRRPGWDWYPDDANGRHAAAYAQFLSDITAETVAHFAAVIKDATGGRSLTGALHGYVMQLTGEPRQHLSGHFAMPPLLDDPNFDLFMGIPLHNFRTLTDGYDTYPTAARSAHAAGKAYLNENDLFSWLHQGLWHRPYNEADPRAGAIAMHRRTFANDMVHNAPRQWFSLFANWHHDPLLQAEFARQMDWQEQLIDADRSLREEIAFVVDDASFAWMPPESALHGQTRPGQLYALARTGAPVGVWLLRDIDRLPDRIRMVVVGDATAARAEDLAKLERLIEAGGRTIVLVGAPGLVDREAWAWDAAGPAALTGLPIEVETGGGPGSPIGPAPEVRPRAVAASDGWAHYTDGATAGAGRALAQGGRLIWSGVPVADVARLREWAAGAGVTLYAPEGCTVYACADLVAVTASAGGELELAWPRAVRVRDLFTGWSAEGDAFPCFFDPGQTRLFRVEPAAG